MKYLIDTNVFLEGLLGQEKVKEVEKDFDRTEKGRKEPAQII